MAVGLAPTRRGGALIVRRRERTEAMMWIFTEQAYVSIVRHRRDRDLLLVRARDRESLVRFCESAGLDEATIEENVAADYRFRVACSDRELADFMEATVHDLDYDNFKNRVASTRGWAWHDILLGIWRMTRNLPDRVTDER